MNILLLQCCLLHSSHDTEDEREMSGVYHQVSLLLLEQWTSTGTVFVETPPQSTVKHQLPVAAVCSHLSLIAGGPGICSCCNNQSQDQTEDKSGELTGWCFHCRLKKLNYSQHSIANYTRKTVDLELILAKWDVTPFKVSRKQDCWQLKGVCMTLALVIGWEAQLSGRCSE